MDSWFSSKANLIHIKENLKKDFIAGIKSNRLISFSPNCEKKEDLQRIDELKLKDEKPVQVYLKGMGFPILLMKKTYKKRWKIEEYHRSIKNNTSLTKSPTKKEKSQLNHLFCSLYGYIKLEAMSLEQKIRLYSPSV